MGTHRRGFLRALGGGVAWWVGRARAADQETLPAIHTGTRNTAFGAVGRRWPRGPASPPFKRYPGKRRLGLPGPHGESRPLALVLETAPETRFAAAALSGAELGNLLQLTNGVTGRSGVGGAAVPLRAAPSAGALYAGEVYAVIRDVSGIVPGVYYYDVRQHQLIRLRAGDRFDRIEAALERPAEIENAALAIVLTNVFGRYTRQYANRGYRYALIDSGHIGENLRLAAHDHELGECAPTRFHDEVLDRLLGIDGVLEATCALHLVGRAAPAAKRSGEPIRTFAEKQALGSAIARERLTERFHEATRLVPATGTPRVAELAPLPVIAGAVSALAEPSAPEMSVAKTIAERRSAERFETRSISLADLSFVLHAIARGRQSERRHIAVAVVAHRVAGLKPGAYLFAPAASELVTLREDDLSDRMADACLRQEKARTAAAGIVMVAPLRAGASELGDRGYRELLIESGAAAQRVYLAAEALGLAARNLAAYVDEPFNKLLTLDRRGLQALHLTMIGAGS